MNFIQCARNQQEQNLKALQYSGSLYFEGVRDIVAGEELLVWYDDMQYDIYMGIPVGYRGKAEEGHRAAVSGECGAGRVWLNDELTRVVIGLFWRVIVESMLI